MENTKFKKLAAQFRAIAADCKCEECYEKLMVIFYKLSYSEGTTVQEDTLDVLYNRTVNIFDANAARVKPIACNL